MTEANARKTANIILAAAAVGAAWYVIKTPPLRRLAWGAVGAALTGALPVWLSREIGTAWAESDRRAI